MVLTLVSDTLKKVNLTWGSQGAGTAATALSVTGTIVKVKDSAVLSE